MTKSLALPSLMGLSLMAMAARPSQVATPRNDRFAAADILGRSAAAYAALQSYADTGTVTQENTTITRSKFRTRFVRPARNFFFEYQALYSEGKSGSGRKLDLTTYHYVFWMLHGELQTYGAHERAHEVFPADGGGQVGAIRGGDHRTYGTSVLVPSLLYSKSGMFGVIQELEEATDAGFEWVGGHRCYKLMGIARSHYPNGRVFNVRPTTVWIDAETFLIRKIFTDTPKGPGLGLVQRYTYTFEPRPNPALHDSLFTFTVPGSQP